jgi:TonB family protein
MTTLMEFFGHPLVHALGWTLLHFLWQGAAIAGLLWCVLALLSGRSSQARYGTACFALTLLVAAPVITLAHIAANEYRMRAALADASIPIDPALILQIGAGEPAGPWTARMAVTLDHSLPWLLALWFAGVIFFVARLNFGLRVARRLKSAGTETPPQDLLHAFDVLRIRLGIARAVALLHSARVQVPTVIGWLRPVVLIPASCLTGLSTEQIEAIFCHELAHVRRHDYLVSVFQSVVEALLFYHPAVWWVSKQVRHERECCCDELAVAMGNDVLAYAKALSYLEERRASFPEFVLGANGGVLTMRIKRLLGFKENALASQFAAFTLLAAVLAVAGSYVVTTARAQQHQPEPVPAGEKIIAPAKVGSTPQSANPPSSSATQEGGSIAGTIVDSSGAVVAGANLRAANADTDQRLAQTTDNLGGYNFSHLPPGRYNVDVMVPGFQRLHQENVRVEEGQKVTLNLKLQVGSVDENLIVAGRAAAPPPPPPPPTVSVDKKAAGPVRVSAGVAAGMIISKVDPIYPPEAKAAQVQGVAVLHAIISKTGEVEDVQIVSGPPMLLVSSIDAVRQWKYKPYLLNGEPIEVQTTININYSLDGTSDPRAPSGQADLAPRKIGGSVSAPTVIYQAEPQFTEEARKAKFSGVVLVNLVVDQEGHPQNVHIVRAVGLGLDEKAVEAVKQYRFNPAMEAGKPVPVEINIEVNFRTVPDATAAALVASPVFLRTAMPVLTARLEPMELSRMLLVPPTQMAQATPPAAATPPAPQGQAASAQPKHELSEEQRAQLERDIAAAKREAAEAAKHLNTPEFRKELEDAQREATEASKRLNTPEFKKELEDAQRQALEAAKRLNTPEFRKQIEDAQRSALEAVKQLSSPEFKKQMEDVQKQLNSAEFKKQLADAKQQMDERNMNLDNREFRKEMEEVRRQIDAAAEEMREARDLANPPASK